MVSEFWLTVLPSFCHWVPRAVVQVLQVRPFWIFLQLRTDIDKACIDTISSSGRVRRNRVVAWQNVALATFSSPASREEYFFLEVTGVRTVFLLRYDPDSIIVIPSYVQQLLGQLSSLVTQCCIFAVFQLCGSSEECERFNIASQYTNILTRSLGNYAKIRVRRMTCKAIPSRRLT
ncbi:hypothetical protein D1872_265530 [compost metagenome]